MTQVARTIGGPGAGKTTRALDLMEMVLQRHVPSPMQVGFVSFTRAARREASERAGQKFGVKPADLEKHGLFRTLHSICYRQLEVQKGQLLVGGQEDSEWLKNALQDDSAHLATRDKDDDYLFLSSGISRTGFALALWDVARNRQVSLEPLWDLAHEADWRTPWLEEIHETVRLYEEAKRKDERYDFCDLLMKFAGKRWSGDFAQPFADVPVQGDVPRADVWFHDEMQDCSLLTSLVFKRLIEPATWAYIGGDDWQSVYSWAGADASIFTNWLVAREELLPLSYRCPSRILKTGNQVMLEGGYKERAFAASREGGCVQRFPNWRALDEVEPGEDTLVLARTNEYARAAAKVLDDNLIPWRPIKGGGTHAAPARAVGVTALVRLRKGERIGGEDIRRLLELIPSRAGGTELVPRGTKTWFDDEEQRKTIADVSLAEVPAVFGTAALAEMIASGRYKEVLEKPAALMAASAEAHGLAMLGNPSVRVGTCHSAKGMQAAHVVALTQIPEPTRRAIETKEGMDEERRLWYVTATRASEKLTIGGGKGHDFDDL